jgi:flagellar hook-basal body complex protein FliE
MAVLPASLTGPLIAPPQEMTSRANGPSGVSFGNVVDRVLAGAAESHQQAESAVSDLAAGRTDNMPGVLMQVAQADLSFRLILEIRNRLSDAYQEVMKMQV